MYGVLFTSLSALSLLCSAQIVQDEMLKLHNDARAQVGLAGLVWNNDLQNEAQLSVDLCPTIHGADSKQESLSWGWPTLTNQGAFENWDKEKPNFIAASATCVPGTICGHYMQIVTSTQVGCGFKKCSEIFGQPSVDTYGCHYSKLQVDPKLTATPAPTVATGSIILAEPSSIGGMQLANPPVGQLPSSFDKLRAFGSIRGSKPAISYSGTVPIAESSRTNFRMPSITLANATRTLETGASATSGVRGKLTTEVPKITQTRRIVNPSPVVLMFREGNRTDDANRSTVFVSTTAQAKYLC